MTEDIKRLSHLLTWANELMDEAHADGDQGEWLKWETVAFRAAQGLAYLGHTDDDIRALAKAAIDHKI